MSPPAGGGQPRENAGEIPHASHSASDPPPHTQARVHSRPHSPPLWLSLLRLARPAQWSKSAFVLIGPFYGLRDLPETARSLSHYIELGASAALAAGAFALASSGCYVVNDIFDRVADRSHPRKCSRPIAAGQVDVTTAWAFAAALFVVAIGLVLMLRPSQETMWVGLALSLYVLNVSLYTIYLKHKVIADVISLSLGFVLRVMGGCAAVGIEPSVWLLNVTFFLSMFLAFGKRLGERRTLSQPASGVGSPDSPGAMSDTRRAIEHRKVQAGYTDALLQMAVVVTAVITLMTYALYVKDQGSRYVVGFNLMWLTMLPATYGLLRCIVMLEHGKYDDPTELAVHDRGFQLAGLAFLALTIMLMLRFGPVAGGIHPTL